MPQLGPEPACTPLDEREMVRAARGGEPRALAGLYERHARALFRTAFHLTGSAADAEDVVHDVFVSLPDALRRYQEVGSFGAWIRRVTVRSALMRLRAARRRHEIPLGSVTAGPARERADAKILGADLWQAVATLPEPIRAVFVLKQIEGYSHQEIACALGISAGASRVRLARALATLRRSLG